MRICVLSHLYPNPEQPAHGVFVQQQVRALKAAGVLVSVISPVPTVPRALKWLRSHWPALQRIPQSAEYEEGVVRYPRFFTLPRALWRTREGGSIARTVGSLIRSGGYDLIHAHTAVPDGDAARRISRECGIPYVCTVHGYDSVWVRQPGAVQAAILAAFREAARVVCVSERIRTGLLKYDPRPDRFTVIHHGVDVSRTGGDTAQRREAGTRPILTVGRLVPQKGFAELIRAISLVRKQIADVRLAIVGTGPERERLSVLIRSLGLDGYVSLPGGMPHDRLLDLYREADVFCMISQDEGFGMVYLEAMARGVPVVGSQGEGIADIIRDGENGLLVPPRNAEAAAEALIHLLTDSDLRARIGEAGRQTAAGLTWAKNAQEHIALYRDVIQASRPGTRP